MADKRFVYADNAATTKITDIVFDAMLPWLKGGYGNPSSIYSLADDSARALLTARGQVANALGADAKEIYFTSGGSEADNWVIKMVAGALAAQGKKHIITSGFEHHAVLHSCEAMKKQGFTITYLPVYSDGIVRVEDVKNAIRPDTALVTILYANNEIGTIQPIAEIGALCKAAGVLFHTDAVQAVGNVPIDVKAQNIDMLSLSAHKLHGPKGVGALYCRRGIVLPNLIDGGGQENGKRAGTENVAGIVGLGVAITEAVQSMQARSKRLCAMRDRLIDGLLTISHARLNGDRNKRLPGNVNISFHGAEGEALLLNLGAQGIFASSGSACTSGSLDPSHVLLAIGLPAEVAHGSLRFTLSDETTDEDISYLLEKVPEVVEKVRGMSPLWEKIVAGSHAIK